MSPRLSQVFLRDPTWIDRCVSRVEPDVFGVEWAAGEGALTEGLSDRWETGLAIELDGRLCDTLLARLDGSGWSVIRADLLDYPLPRRFDPYQLVGNLPYHLTGPALMRVLDNLDRLERFYGLVQREVADRLEAQPGDSEYRGISLLFQWAGRVRKPYDVPAEAFDPQPDVDSAWIEFEPEMTGGLNDRPQLAEAMFHMPRKTLLNNLSAMGEDKQTWRSWMEERGWDTKRRPHTLEPSEFEELYQTWTHKNESS